MKYISEKHIELGHIQSYWSWEYDTTIIQARLYMDITNFNLILDFTKTHIKTGIGAGETKAIFATYRVGTFFKPQLKLISSLLAKHKQIDRPFRRKGWMTEYSKSIKLSEVFAELKEKEDIIIRAIKLNKIKKLMK